MLDVLCAALQGDVGRWCSRPPVGWPFPRSCSSLRPWLKGQRSDDPLQAKMPHVLRCCLSFSLCGSDGFNPQICWFIPLMDRFIVPLWSMHLALLTSAFLLFPSFYQTLFALSVPSFHSDLPPLSLSLSFCHTHPLFPSVPPSLCFLFSLLFLFSLPPSPSPSHSLDWFWHSSPLISEHTHTRSEQRCHCRGDVSRRGLIQSDTCSLPSFPIAMEAITHLLKGLLSECVCVLASSEAARGEPLLQVSWLAEWKDMDESHASFCPPSCLNSSFTWTLHPLRAACLSACLCACVPVCLCHSCGQSLQSVCPCRGTQPLTERVNIWGM